MSRGATYPRKIRISCGWPGATKRGALLSVVGSCWTPTASSDGTTEIFISPLISKSTTVVSILIHELVHACGCKGHGVSFRKLATSIGLTGPMRATVAGDPLKILIRQLVKAIGPYPHASLNPTDDRSDTPKKQGTRMIKVVCPTCTYTVRTTSKWLSVGLPTCPCGDEMQADIGQGEEGEPE
jgi:hypothetical protein